MIKGKGIKVSEKDKGVKIFIIDKFEHPTL